jgi:hypothetical protein
MEHQLDESSLAAAPTRELIRQLARDTRELVKKEVELARAEMRFDVVREKQAIAELGVASVCALATLNLMLVAAAFALARVMPDWAAALAVAAVVLAVGSVAGIVGWRTRVKQPLERTQKTVKEDVQWTKERLA